MLHGHASFSLSLFPGQRTLRLSSGSWWGKDTPDAGAAMGLGLVPKQHIWMQAVAGASGRLSTATTENQYPGEAVKKKIRQKIFLPRWVLNKQDGGCQLVRTISGAILVARSSTKMQIHRGLTSKRKNRPFQE